MFARGNRRHAIFQDSDDYALYLRLLAGIVVSKRWRVLAYCLMPNHVHLLIETPEANLARGMQHLHGLYARIFNDRYGLSGHLFQGRYGSRLVRDDVQFATVARYLALNPVDGGLCRKPAEWDWNSFGPVIEQNPPGWLDHDRLLSHLGGEVRDPLRRYGSLVNDALRATA